MKRTDWEKLLRNNGWRLERHGGNHDAWTTGEQHETIARHAEISEGLAKAIIKRRGLKQSVQKGAKP